MTDEDADVLPATVGLLLWRPAPGGRELCALELGERTVLPKGVLRPGEDEPRAARRLARDLLGAHTREPEPLAPPPGGGGAVAWWRLRWDSPVDGSPRGKVRRVWLRGDDAQVVLAHRFERELVRAARLSWLARVRERLDRPRAARARRTRWELDDLRARIVARPDAPAGPTVPSWRARALALHARMTESLAEGDTLGAADAEAEIARLELFGSDAAVRAERRDDLARAIESELDGEEREAAAADLARGVDAADLARAAARVDSARAARALAVERRTEEQASLGGLIAVLIAFMVLFGEGAWFAGPGPSASAGGMHLAVLLFGLLGGAASALLAPARGPVLLRPAVGGALALILYALVSSGTLALGDPAPGGWLVVAFAAGFFERLVSPRP